MKKMEFKGLDVSYYTETLENGLQVVLLPMENKKNYFISYATRYGSEITRFVPAGEKEEICVPDGIAHFLEHKMFEQENGEDPFTFFSKSGTGSNASTDYDSTQYICYGTKNFKENLRYLLDFVNAPYYTDENVNKEKGIIAEELKMYNDIPDYRLEMKIKENIYHVHPRRVDIGGSVDSIYKITKEDLYKCYNSFYSPNNMYIICVGNFNYKEAINTICEAMELRENMGKAIPAKIKEEETVFRKSSVIHADISIPKVAYGVKLKKKDYKISEMEYRAYIGIISSILFGSTSEFREENTNNGLLLDFGTEIEHVEGYVTYYVYAYTNDTKEVINKIRDNFNKDNLTEEAFNRMKKVMMASKVRATDDVDQTFDTLYGMMLVYGDIVSDSFEILRNLDYNKMIEIFDDLDFSNYSTVTMLPKDSE